MNTTKKTTPSSPFPTFVTLQKIKKKKAFCKTPTTNFHPLEWQENVWAYCNIISTMHQSMMLILWFLFSSSFVRSFFFCDEKYFTFFSLPLFGNITLWIWSVFFSIFLFYFSSMGDGFCCCCCYFSQAFHSFLS